MQSNITLAKMPDIGELVIMHAKGIDANPLWDLCTGKVAYISGNSLQVKISNVRNGFAPGEIISFHISVSGWAWEYLVKDWDN